MGAGKKRESSGASVRRYGWVILAALLFALSRPALEPSAAVWVSPGTEIKAEAAIVIDADTKAVLWGKNIDDRYYPASITKLMTALLVLENCGLDEEAEATGEAVNGLEAGAVTIGLEAGDRMSVEDLLYALLFKSANDAANVLAVHVSGSIEAFAGLMNKKAAELGCTRTDFKNPSGLTYPENFTTARDMALIGAACAENEKFLEIESHDSHKLGPTTRYPDGGSVSPGHKMLRPDTQYSDDRVIGGKTGYISASGNTLVTIAEDGGRKVVAVCLKDKNPEHYNDTRVLIDFGLNEFKNVEIEDPAAVYDCASRLRSDMIADDASDNIVSYANAKVTIPLAGDISELEPSYDYNIPENAPDMAVARLDLIYAGVVAGSAWILNDKESVIEVSGVEEEAAGEAEAGVHAFPAAAAAGAVILTIAGIAGILICVAYVRARRREAISRKQRVEKRLERMSDLDISEEDFQRMKRELRSGRGK